MTMRGNTSHRNQGGYLLKKNLIMMLSLIFILILAACGQGTGQAGSEPEKDGIETVENTELDETAEVETDEEPAEEPKDEEPAETVDEDEVAVEADEDQPEEETDAAVNETPVELIFSDEDVMNMYRVERTIEAKDDDLFVATLEAWIAGPTEEELVSLLPEGVKVQSVEEKDGVAYVYFSEELLNAQVGSGTEEMLYQQIAMTMKQFGFNETQILVDGEVHPELFGHIDTSQPIAANNLEDYEKVE